MASFTKQGSLRGLSEKRLGTARWQGAFSGEDPAAASPPDEPSSPQTALLALGKAIAEHPRKQPKRPWDDKDDAALALDELTLMEMGGASTPWVGSTERRVALAPASIKNREEETLLKTLGESTALLIDDDSRAIVEAATALAIKDVKERKKED